MFLEVIAKDLNDIKQINASVADRIELCGAMEEDGLTPELDLIKQAAKITQKPMRVMIRNHNNGFYFTPEEIEVMLSQIEAINKIDNIDGYVIGCLNENQTEIDIQAMERLIKAANGRNITFHKACEQLIHNTETIDLLVKLGVNTVLTQGGTKPIDENYKQLTMIQEYIEANGYKLQLLIGGGVNYTNAIDLAKINPVLHVGKIIRTGENYDTIISVSKILKIKGL